MKIGLLILASTAIVTGVASAQGLSEGVFICHHPPGIWYSTDITSYCGYCTLTNCEDQNPTCPDDATQWVWFIVSNFWQTQSFNAIEYGISYGGAQYTVTSFGVCAPAPFMTIEYPAAGSWPQDGSAIAIALSSTPDWSGTFVPTSWIAGYHYPGYAAGQITLVPSPATQFMGWLSNGEMYRPAYVGALGVGGVAGTAVCSRPAEIRACCLPNYGGCEDLSEAECLVVAGTWQSVDVLCASEPCPTPPPSWACCLPDYGPCVMVTEADCLEQQGTWLADVECASEPCATPPVWACCLPDYSGCADVATLAECDLLGGQWFEGQLCAADPCPTAPVHACCLADYVCQDLTESDCTAQQGTWLADSLCVDNPCPQPPLGACCTNGGTTCTVTTEADCLAAQGLWYAEDDCAEPVPCIITGVTPDTWGEVKNLYR